MILLFLRRLHVPQQRTFTPPAVILNLRQMKHFKYLVSMEDSMVGSLRGTRNVYKLVHLKEKSHFTSAVLLPT